jgi:hypothetical protein
MKSLVTDVVAQYTGFGQGSAGGSVEGSVAPHAEEQVSFVKICPSGAGEQEPASNLDEGMEMGECGPEGCEIVW